MNQYQKYLDDFEKMNVLKSQINNKYTIKYLKEIWNYLPIEDQRKVIHIRENKTTLLNECITSVTNSNGITIYSYYNGKQIEPKKSTFNKASFIEYLKSIQLPKKYIKQVDSNM